MRLIDEHKCESLYGINAVFAEMKECLSKEVGWLSQCFGRVWKVQEVVNGKKIIFPSLYVGNNQYENVSPSDDLGNYSFFTLNDPTDLDNGRGYDIYNASLIMWMDLRKCFSGHDMRELESLKREVRDVVTRRFSMRNVFVSVTRVYEDAKNVFNGFTFDETTNQSMMQPYAALRFDLQIRIYNVCLR